MNFETASPWLTKTAYRWICQAILFGFATRTARHSQWRAFFFKTKNKCLRTPHIVTQHWGRLPSSLWSLETSLNLVVCPAWTNPPSIVRAICSRCDSWHYLLRTDQGHLVAIGDPSIYPAASWRCKNPLVPNAVSSPAATPLFRIQAWS